MNYQIYVDRKDGQGLSLDGCWGSEHAKFDNEAEGLDALKFLAKEYPDCDWVLTDSDDYEVERIVATELAEDNG